MSSPVISVESLSKLYRLGEITTGTLSHDLNRWWHKVRGKEDPYLEIGQVNDRARKANASSPKSSSDYVYALKDINFTVNQGEVLGIIGRNGAGKSTLLKILSRVTAPTSGRIKVKGRVASLLEVGTGFHPELSGRENIYLNGAILGMRRNEINRKLDEIVDFSGCAAYLDTAVKRYSSGMAVRLGFAVAAYLEADILIIDEVLAVGDVEFQKKCIGKIQNVSRQGTTVLFVSHNMAAIARLCTRAIELKNGGMTASGSAQEMIRNYFAETTDSPNESKISYVRPNNLKGNEFVRVIELSVESQGEQAKSNFETTEPIIIKLVYEILKKADHAIVPSVDITTEDNIYAFGIGPHAKPESIMGFYEFKAVIPKNFLNEGVYYIGFGIFTFERVTICHVVERIATSIHVKEGEGGVRLYGYGGNVAGVVRPKLENNLKKL